MGATCSERDLETMGAIVATILSLPFLVVLLYLPYKWARYHWQLGCLGFARYRPPRSRGTCGGFEHPNEKQHDFPNRIQREHEVTTRARSMRNKSDVFSTHQNIYYDVLPDIVGENVAETAEVYEQKRSKKKQKRKKDKRNSKTV